MIRLLVTYAVSILFLFQRTKGLAVPVPDPETVSMLQDFKNLTLSSLTYLVPLASNALSVPPSQRRGNQITADDVLVAVAHTSTERPLPPEDTTRFLWLSMVNYFNTAAGRGGDQPLPKVRWRKQWDAMELIVVPAFDQDMRLSEVFFALGWIWSFMAVPLVEFKSLYEGFHERDYVIFRKQPDGNLIIVGYIKLGYRTGFQSEQAALGTTNNITSVGLANATDTPPTAISYPWSPIFGVPESKVWLYFLQPRTALPYGADGVISYLLLSILQQAWSVMIQHNGGYSFPPTIRTHAALGLTVAIDPKKAGYKQQSLLTASMMADTAFGMVYYMLHEGFTAGKTNIKYPTVSGMRITLGDILIKYSGDGKVGGNANDTGPAVATS